MAGDGLAFCGGGLPRFLLYGLAFRPQNYFGTFSSCQVFCFRFFLSFFNFVSSTSFLPFLFFFLFKRQKRSVSNRTHPPRACYWPVVFLLLSRRVWFIACCGRASFSWCFLGVARGRHSGRRACFGFSWNLRGLSSLALSEALSGREAARVFLCFSSVVFDFPFCCVCGGTLSRKPE